MPVPKQKSALYACKTELKVLIWNTLKILHTVSGTELVEESRVAENITQKKREGHISFSWWHMCKSDTTKAENSFSAVRYKEFPCLSLKF